MSAAALAVLDDLSGLGPDVDELLGALVRSEQGPPLPLFAAEPRAAHWLPLRGQPMSRSLADVLQQVDDLSDGQGFQLLTAYLGAVGVDAPRGLSRQGLALWAATHHRAAFDQAHRYRREVRRCRMRTFRGREAVEPSQDHPLARERLRRRLAEAFEATGRTEHCRVLTYDDEEGLHYLIDHGSNLRHIQTVHRGPDGFVEQRVGLRPRRRDYVHYAPRTGVLSVGAWDASTLRAYGTAFGELLFGDPAWFAMGTLVSLEPLRDLGRRALLPSPDVIEAKLVRLSLKAPGLDETLLTVDAPDVFDALERNEARGMLESGEPVRARIRVRVAGVARRRLIDLESPGIVGYDWRKGGGAVRRFLERRGFLAVGAP